MYQKGDQVPGELSSRMVVPCASAINRAIDRPPGRELLHDPPLRKADRITGYGILFILDPVCFCFLGSLAW